MQSTWRLGKSVAYAEFSKGGGRKLENIEDQKKTFSTQNQSVFLPKIRCRTKKKRTGLYPDSVLLCAQTFCPSYKGGGHAAILHSILCYLYYPGDPKGGPWHHAPPKYPPGVNVCFGLFCLADRFSKKRLKLDKHFL